MFPGKNVEQQTKRKPKVRVNKDQLPEKRKENRRKRANHSKDANKDTEITRKNANPIWRPSAAPASPPSP